MRRPVALLLSLPLTLAACPRSSAPVEPDPGVIEPAPADAEPEPEPEPSPEGPLRYRGEVVLPGRGPLAFFVELLPGDDGHAGTITIPGQGFFDSTLDGIVVAAGELAFSMPSTGARWTATVDASGIAKDCQLEQGGVRLPCTLDPIDAAALAEVRSPPRPQTPKPPFPYDVAEVGYDNEADGVHLAGTLTLPQGPGPFPAALLITGSGPQDRDASMMGHKTFWVLADHLTRQGIAVLRVDDRGVGGSTGILMDSPEGALVRDAAAGVAHLRAHPRIDPARIGVIGHSEGGIIGPRVAAAEPTLAFVVMMAGTGVPGHEIIREQSVAILRAKGAPASTIELARHQQAKLLQIVLDHGPEQARPKLVEMTGDSAQVDMMLTPWFQSFIHYDPVPTLKKVRCPVLVLNGELDLQVLPDQNIPAIESALAGNAKQTTIHRLPGLNHLFQTAKTGSPDEYMTIEETLAPQVLTLIGDWVVAQTDPAAQKGKPKKRKPKKRKPKT